MNTKAYIILCINLMVFDGMGASISSAGETDVHTVHQYSPHSPNPLVEAAKEGSLELIQAYLRGGGDVDALYEGRTLLHIACARGKFSLVHLLTRNGAYINKLNTTNFTPLHKAIEHGHDDIALYLLGLGAIVNTCNKDGMTPLHTAANGGSNSMIDALLRSGATAIDEIDKFYRTPLHLFLKSLKKGCSKSTIVGIDTPEHANGLMAGAHMLIDRGADLRKVGGSAADTSPFDLILGMVSLTDKKALIDALCTLLLKGLWRDVLRYFTMDASGGPVLTTDGNYIFGDREISRHVGEYLLVNAAIG